MGTLGTSFYWLVLGTLAVWRITHLLAVEDGPWNLIVKLRQLVGAGFWGSLLACFYCLSLWIAAPVAYEVGSQWRDRVLLWLSFSGAAILLERATSHDADPPAYSEYVEKQEEK